MSGQIQSLLIKAAAIQREIDGAERLRSSDWLRVLRLKALRLRIRYRLGALVERALARAHPIAVH